MSVLFNCDRFTVFEPSSDGEAVALDNMQEDKYIYYLQFNHALFQSVAWFDRMIMVCSDTPLTITPPQIQFKKCLFDAIAKLQNNPNNFADVFPQPTIDEFECMRELPNGWKLSTLQQFIGYRSEPLPEINYEMQRLQWYLGAPHISEAEQVLFIHPELDRPLTGLEWSAIAQASDDTALQRWLGWLESVATAGPSPLASQEHTEGNRTILDWRPLTRYPAIDVYPYANRREPAHLFNIVNGKLRVPWQLISRCCDGTLTYATQFKETEEGID